MRNYSPKLRPIRKLIITFALIFFGSILDSKISKESLRLIVESPSPQVLSTESIPPPTNLQKVKVTRVIDGDTIEIDGGFKVRYIGVDAPEKDHPCYLESKARNKELVDGKMVSLEKDVSETDKFGRLLRYVYLGDSMVNETLIKEGFAAIATYPPDVKYKQRFLRVLINAQNPSTTCVHYTSISD